MQEKLTKIWIQLVKTNQQFLYSPKWLEEIVLFRNDLSAHQESDSSLTIICNEKTTESRPLPSCVVVGFLVEHF